MTKKIEAKIVNIVYLKGEKGIIAEVTIQKILTNEYVNKPEIRIGLIGEQSSGKSTIVGVLISSEFDDGNGEARFNVFKHKHEIKCGKSSSLSHQIIGLNEKGIVNNHSSFGKLSWEQIIQHSSKIINFFDMGGSIKYLKKSVYYLARFLISLLNTLTIFSSLLQLILG